MLAAGGIISVIRLLLLCVGFKFGKLEAPGYWLEQLPKNMYTATAKLERAKNELRRWFATIYKPQTVEYMVERSLKDHQI
jgi:hypothetical protein